MGSFRRVGYDTFDLVFPWRNDGDFYASTLLGCRDEGEARPSLLCVLITYLLAARQPASPPRASGATVVGYLLAKVLPKHAMTITHSDRPRTCS